MLGLKGFARPACRNLYHSRLIRPCKDLQFAKRFYSRKIDTTQQAPKIRYLFYMVFFSSGLLYLAGKSVDKKQPKTTFTEREYKEYEERTGLKRRQKLVSYEKNEKYKFYVIPYVTSDDMLNKFSGELKDKENVIIDPQDLVKREMEDESKKYCYLLQDLTASNKPYPKGLITAIIKEEIQFFLNTTKGTYDTNFIIKNYPQTTDEAIKFENDVSDIAECIIFDSDSKKGFIKDQPEKSRLIENVVGYFETVGKSRKI